MRRSDRLGRPAGAGGGCPGQRAEDAAREQHPARDESHDTGDPAQTLAAPPLIPTGDLGGACRRVAGAMPQLPAVSQSRRAVQHRPDVRGVHGLLERPPFSRQRLLPVDRDRLPVRRVRRPAAHAGLRPDGGLRRGPESGDTALAGGAVHSGVDVPRRAALPAAAFRRPADLRRVCDYGGGAAGLDLCLGDLPHLLRRRRGADDLQDRQRIRDRPGDGRGAGASWPPAARTSTSTSSGSWA